MPKLIGTMVKKIFESKKIAYNWSAKCTLRNSKSCGPRLICTVVTSGWCFLRACRQPARRWCHAGGLPQWMAGAIPCCWSLRFLLIFKALRCKSFRMCRTLIFKQKNQRSIWRGERKAYKKEWNHDKLQTYVMRIACNKLFFLVITITIFFFKFRLNKNQRIKFRLFLVEVWQVYCSRIEHVLALYYSFSCGLQPYFVSCKSHKRRAI
jgi:hypothetical protein